MLTYHEFDKDGLHYRLVYDELHETRGSYAYETEEETRKAEDEEIANLESGEWVALGVIVTKPCPDHNHHCQGCSGIVEVDNYWGLVVENSIEVAEREASCH